MRGSVGLSSLRICKIIRSKQLYGKKHKPKRISDQALEIQISEVLPLHFVEKQTNKQQQKPKQQKRASSLQLGKEKKNL